MGFIKQPVVKQGSTFLSFSFLIDCCISVFFSFFIKAFPDFEKLIRFHWQAFIVYKNGENLKILIEIFCQKLLVFSVILAFLNHLKPKSFFVGQPWWPTQSALPFQNLWIRACMFSIFNSFVFFFQSRKISYIFNYVFFFKASEIDHYML